MFQTLHLQFTSQSHKYIRMQNTIIKTKFNFFQSHIYHICTYYILTYIFVLKIFNLFVIVDLQYIKNNKINKTHEIIHIIFCVLNHSISVVTFTYFILSITLYN